MSLNKLNPLKSRTKNEIQSSLETPRIQQILVKSFSGTMSHGMVNDIDSITKLSNQPPLPIKQRKRASTMVTQQQHMSNSSLPILDLSGLTQFNQSDSPQDVDAVYFSNSHTELQQNTTSSMSQLGSRFSLFNRKKNVSLTILPYSPTPIDPVDIDTILITADEVQQVSPVLSNQQQSTTKSNAKLDANLTTQYTQLGTGGARRLNGRSPLSAYITTTNDVNDILLLGFSHSTVNLSVLLLIKIKISEKMSDESYLVNVFAGLEDKKENVNVECHSSYDVMNIDIDVESRDISSIVSKDQI